MSAPTQLPPPKVRWDLSALFESADDPRLESVWDDLRAQAEAIAEKYRGQIDREDLDPDFLAQGIRDLERLSNELAKPLSYASLLFTTDTANPAYGALMMDQQERATEISVLVMFFELELQKAPEAAIQRALQSEVLAPYRHFIEVARTYSPHRLTEPEEIVLEETANTGIRAWVRFFEETTAAQTYRFTDPRTGESKDLTQEEVINLLREANREVRQAAADAFSEGMEKLQRISAFVYNTILLDRKTGDRMRKHPYPEHSRHLSNELEKETVDLVIRLCREYYPLVARFYHVKREILGLPELTHIDRYAPLFEAEEQVGFEEGRDIVLEAFGSFSPVLRDTAAEFFEKNWIDAEPRAGKQGGAFCSYNTPDTHPVVLMSYLNKMDDVGTLAHELGHGVHASLSRGQTYFNFHGTLPLAELASTFGEMLVFEKLVAQASTKDKLALYAEKVEGVFATVFRQAAMFQFEQACHAERREEGELTPDRFAEIWQEKLQEMFGDSVKLGDQHARWWSYVWHFFGAPFYVYAYSFGELLVLSLYQKAKAEGPAFAPRYEQLLRLGGSLSPQELMGTVGIDLNSEEFWRGGFAVMEGLVAEFERLWGEVRG